MVELVGGDLRRTTPAGVDATYVERRNLQRAVERPVGQRAAGVGDNRLQPGIGSIQDLEIGHQLEPINRPAQHPEVLRRDLPPRIEPSEIRRGKRQRVEHDLEVWPYLTHRGGDAPDDLDDALCA